MFFPSIENFVAVTKQPLFYHKIFYFLKKERSFSSQTNRIFRHKKHFFRKNKKKVLGVKTKEKVKELAHMEEQEG